MSKYINVQLTRIGITNYILSVSKVNNEDFTSIENKIYSKTLDDIMSYLSKNNYKPSICDEYSFKLEKNIKRHTTLINKLKKIIDRNFQFTYIYMINN